MTRATPVVPVTVCVVAGFPVSLLALQTDGSARLGLLEFMPGLHGERPHYILTWHAVEVVEP